MVILGVGFGLVWLLVLALYGCWLWLCGGWFWLCPHLVVGCGHMLLLVVTTARCVVGLLDVASFGCWLWPRVLWATPAPNWQLSTGALASWPWSPRCNLTKKSLKFFLGQGLVRISWEMCMGYVAKNFSEDSDQERIDRFSNNQPADLSRKFYKAFFQAG